jgi:hypothetical protein
VLPVVAAVGGVLAPAAIYLRLATPATAKGWSVPTATDVAFTIGILALLGDRVPGALRVFVAALAVVDDILSMLTLAIFYPHSFDATWLLGAAIAAALLFALNRARVYAGWPYAVVACALWVMLHASGVHAALAGVILAVFLPTRPAPAAAPLLAQAATALAALESAEREARKVEPSAHARQKARADPRVGQSQPVGRERAPAVASRTHRTRRCAMERVFHPAAVRVFGDRHQSLCRPALRRRHACARRRRPRPRARQADRRAARIVAHDQGAHRHRSKRHEPAPVHRRGVPVRCRRHGRADGRPGVFRSATSLR